MIYQQLLSCSAGISWVILILPDMSALKLVKLNPCFFELTILHVKENAFFFPQKGIPTRR